MVNNRQQLIDNLEQVSETTFQAFKNVYVAPTWGGTEQGLRDMKVTTAVLFIPAEKFDRVVWVMQRLVTFQKQFRKNGLPVIGSI